MPLYRVDLVCKEYTWEDVRADSQEEAEILAERSASARCMRSWVAENCEMLEED